jgi:hypothetical protein
MKQQLKMLALAVTALIALVGVVFSAHATAPGFARAGDLALPSGSPHMARMLPFPRAACTDMEPSEVAWVTLNEDFEIEDQVESYPSGTTLITPVFEYACVPKKVTIVTVFSLNGEVVFSDKEALKASNADGLYGYPLGTTDESPMDDGVWGVEYFNNKSPLTSGEVVVGEGEDPIEGETVTVEGTVKDKKTKKAIKGAIVLVLNPGTTVEDWVDGGQEDSDVYTAGQTNSKGQFTLEDPLTRNEVYSLIVVAKGYKPIATDEFVIEDDVEDPVQLDVVLTK